jgi:hypothetical protein
VCVQSPTPTHSYTCLYLLILAKQVNAVCPRWLLLVQGVGDPARSEERASQFFWGENLGEHALSMH